MFKSAAVLNHGSIKEFAQSKIFLFLARGISLYLAVKYKKENHCLLIIGNVDDVQVIFR
jgi:hypothetical protein